MSKNKIPSVPQVMNIAEMKATPKKFTLIHFTADQWKTVTKGAKEGRALKKGHPYIEYTPLPDGGGIVQADCGSPSPDEECMVRPVIDRPEPRPGPRPGPGPGPELDFIPEGAPVRWECRCRPIRDPNPPVVVRPACELIVERRPRLRIRCSNNSCNRNCALRFVRVGRRIQLTCECS